MCCVCYLTVYILEKKIKRKKPQPWLGNEKLMHNSLDVLKIKLSHDFFVFGMWFFFLPFSYIIKHEIWYYTSVNECALCILFVFYFLLFLLFLFGRPQCNFSPWQKKETRKNIFQYSPSPGIFEYLTNYLFCYFFLSSLLWLNVYYPIFSFYLFSRRHRRRHWLLFLSILIVIFVITSQVCILREKLKSLSEGFDTAG